MNMMRAASMMKVEVTAMLRGAACAAMDDTPPRENFPVTAHIPLSSLGMTVRSHSTMSSRVAIATGTSAVRGTKKRARESAAVRTVTTAATAGCREGVKRSLPPSRRRMERKLILNAGITQAARAQPAPISTATGYFQPSATMLPLTMFSVSMPLT